MKISKAEFAVLALAVTFFAFLGGWCARAGTWSGENIRVETQYALSGTGLQPELREPASTPDGGGDAAAPREKIDLNTADVQDLQTLPGIGRVLAERIVAYRRENGPFRTVEELTEVRGIGEKTLAGLEEYVRVG